MKRPWVMSALMSAVWLLQACGGGGGDGGALEGPPLEALKPLSAVTCNSNGRTVHIQLFGDSTQKGETAGGIVTRTPAVALQDDLEALFGPGSVSVESRAASGTSSYELLIGSDGQNQRWPLSVTGDIVVINHGINDARRNGLVDEYRQRIDELTTKSPVDVVLETPNPIQTIDMAPFAQAMRDVAKSRGAVIAETYGYVSGLPLGGWPYLSDGVHPTENLYGHIVRSALLPAVMPLVQAKRCS